MDNNIYKTEEFYQKLIKGIIKYNNGVAFYHDGINITNIEVFKYPELIKTGRYPYIVYINPF